MISPPTHEVEGAQAATLRPISYQKLQKSREKNCSTLKGHTGAPRPAKPRDAGWVAPWQYIIRVSPWPQMRPPRNSPSKRMLSLRQKMPWPWNHPCMNSPSYLEKQGKPAVLHIHQDSFTYVYVVIILILVIQSLVKIVVVVVRTSSSSRSQVLENKLLSKNS